MRLNDIFKHEAAVDLWGDASRRNAIGQEPSRTGQSGRIVGDLGIVIAAQGKVLAQGDLQRKGRGFVAERAVNDDSATRSGRLGDRDDLGSADRIEGRIDPIRRRAWGVSETLCI